MAGSTLADTLAQADQDWTFGLLTAARRGYEAALTSDPSSWHASLQTAWIDSAFERIDPDRISKLERPGLGAEALQRIEMLRAAKPVLSGDRSAWDIESLRTRPDASSAAWWEKNAALANDARQYGLALACFQEAELLAPARYYDPPRVMQGLPLQAETQLRIARGG